MTGESSSAERERMLFSQITLRGVKDTRVLNAMRNVPREKFVLAEDTEKAYYDSPLPIGCHQTISQPYIVAYMTEQLHIQPDDIVLDIGTGSGYQAAIFSQLAKHVYTIEYLPMLARKAALLFQSQHYQNISVIEGDGSGGLPEHAPYNAILLAAAAPDVPQALIQQLARGGRMILPIGGKENQILRLVTRMEDGSIVMRDLITVVFVPLRGKFGWQTNEWVD